MIVLPAFEWQPGLLLRTETARFLIRSLTSQDATPRYVGWWNDPVVQGQLRQPVRNWTQTEAQRHIGRFDNRSGFHLGIFPHGESLPIGFFTITAQPAMRLATTATVLGEQGWWGKDVPLEVRGHMLHFIFGALGMEKAKGVIHGRNLPSIFNSEALGFRCEGILRGETLGQDGKRIDAYLYGLLKSEWESMHERT